MDSLSIYDLLVGSFVFRGDEPGEVDDAYFDDMDEEEKLRSSIVENIKMILQSRRDNVDEESRKDPKKMKALREKGLISKASISHLPDFGLPDIREIYFNEGSIDSIPKLIEESLLKYEPRLQQVKVKRKRFDTNNLRLSLQIEAKIKDHRGSEVLLTEFSSTGWLKVVFDRDDKKEKEG